MTSKRLLAFCGSLLSIVILISSQYQLVLGQDETSAETETFSLMEQASSEEGGEVELEREEEQACPCILRSECPRIYGENPLDFSELGHVGPCAENGFVRCCGVSVSIVQQTDESPTGADAVDDEASWGSESAQEQQESSADENSSNENDNKDDLHESGEGHDEEVNEKEDENDAQEVDAEEGSEEPADDNEKDINEEQKASDEEQHEDILPAESKQEAQTVMVEPTGFSPRKRFLRKFHRPGPPADDSQEPTVLGSSSSGETGNGEDGSSELSLEGEGKPSSLGDSGGSSIVYSQRVTDYPAYRTRNNNNHHNNNTPNAADSAYNDGLHKFSKGPDSADGEESSPANVGNRPKFQMRRRRPINQMRNRVQPTSQQDSDVGSDYKTPVDVEESAENNNEPNGLNGAAASFVQNSPETVHISIQADQDELDNQRRPMSRLVKQRVSALNRGRNKRPNSSGTIIGGEHTESLQSTNFDGQAPISDNGSNGEALSDELKQQELLGEKETDNESTPTIGSEAEESTGPLSSSKKVYQNSPTGKLLPPRPKIRSFPRMKANHMLTTSEGDSSASVSSDSTNSDINQQSEGQQEVEPDMDAKPVQHTQTRPNGVTIRKVPMRRVKPAIPETNNDSQNEMNTEELSQVPTSPLKGRPIMRRPINSLLKNNKQASLADHETHLEETQAALREPQHQPEIKIEKLDVRERLRGRHRNNPLKALTSSPTTETSPNEESLEEHENMDNPGENLSASTSSSEPGRPFIMRKRVRPLRRPSALGGQGQAQLSLGENDGKLAEDNSADNVKALTSNPNPELSSVEEESEEKQTAEIPRVKIRIGMARFPSLRRGQQQQETSSDPSTPIPISTDETANADSSEPNNALRQRQRLTSNRGKLRRPQSTGIISATSGADGESGLSDMSATSETPVTVTSTYSRIRSNNKNGFPARPYFRRPTTSSIKQSEEIEAVTSSPEESTPTIKDTPATTQASGFGTRTRFGVQSRYTSTTPEPEPAPAQPDKELEKPGQLTELNETPEDNSSHVQEKRVGFGKRKRIRVRVRPQQEEQQEEKVQNSNGEEEREQQQQTQQQQEEQQQLLSNNNDQEIKHPTYGGVGGANPETQNSEHVGSEDSVAFHSPSISVPLNSNQEAEEESPSPGNHSGDQAGKIRPAGELSSKTEHRANPHRDEHDDSKQHYDDEHMDTESYHLQHPTATVDMDSDTYDLILNKDVRKTLGTLNTHSTHSAGQSGAYKVDGENGQAEDDDDEDDNGSLHHHPSSSSSSYHPNHHHQDNNNQQQHSSDNYYDQYEHRDNTAHSDSEHKYSNGIRSQASSRPSSPSSSSYSNNNGVHRETDDMGSIETLELGTPDYDTHPYNDWHSYEDDLDEDEEESRVQEKFLTNNNRSRFNKSSLATTKGSSSSSIAPFTRHRLTAQKENRDDGNEGKQQQQREELGLSPSPVNPLNGGSPSYASAESSEPTQGSSSSSDALDLIRKDGNKRIRQKLRRPPTAYINNSGESTFNKPQQEESGHSSAPFTPSIPSPRPTYSGNDALLESVNQSVLSLPKSSESLSNYPDSKPLEQFIQNKQQLTPERRNRTRVRVKLVTLPTTTPAPTYLSSNNDPFDGNNGNEKEIAPDAAAAASPLEGSPRRPTHSGFTFPPFKKSKLALITSTEMPSEETASVPYSPQQVIFNPAPVTTTAVAASSTNTTSRPFKAIMDNYNNRGSLSPGQTSGGGGGAGSSGLPVTRHNDNLTSSGHKYGTRHRFKVSELNSSTSPSSSSSPSPVQPSSQSNEQIEPVRKPQIRLRAPEYRRRIPTTPAPIRHHQVSPSTSAPIYSSNENQSPPRQEAAITSSSSPSHQQPTPVLPTNEKYNSRPSVSVTPSAYEQEEEQEHDTISIRITSHPNDVIDQDTAPVEKEPDQQSQYVPAGIRQQQNMIENTEPNYIPHLASAPLNKHNGKESSSTYSANGAPALNQKGKYSSRFKVPEKFHHQKQGALAANNMIQPALPSSSSQMDFNAGKERPMNVVVETESNFKTKYPYDDNEVSVKVEPAPLPPSPPPHHHQAYDNYGNSQQNEVDMNLDNNVQYEKSPPAPYHHNIPSGEEEMKPTQPEFIPDIRINVHPLTATHNGDDGEQVSHDYDGVFHAVRERPLPPPPQRHPSSSSSLGPNILRHSPFGPFPSTDHWSGIPSANSPKLPDFFEHTRQPISHPSHFDEQKPEFDTDLRVLTTTEPNIRPMVRFPEHQNVQFIDNQENLPQPPVESTLVQFGTDFDGDEEEEEVEQQRPQTLSLNNNLNLHGSQLPKQPIEFPVLGGNRDPQIPLGAPHPPPANFQHRPIQTVVVPPQSSVTVPVPLPGQTMPPGSAHFMRPQVIHNNMQQQHHSTPPHFPSNEHHPQFVSKPGHPQQEPNMGMNPHGPRPNSIPPRPISHGLREGEFKNPQFRLPHPDGGNKEVRFRQPQPQFPQNQQQPNGNNHFRVTEPLRQHQNPKQQHHQINPHQQQQHPNMGESFLKQERPREPHPQINAPQFNSQLAPGQAHPPMHFDGRHPDAPLRNVVKQQGSISFEKPLEQRPVQPNGNVVFEKEPEVRPIHAQQQQHGPPQHGPQQQPNKFPTQQLVNTRDPLQRPGQPPKSQIKFPESISQGFAGQQQALPPRPGQFGPPPPSQLQLPQYVPFNMGQERPLRNESEKQVPNIQSRPPHHPMLPQGPQQPVKFGGAQSFPPFSHPPRQNPNGNLANPQQYIPHHRPPQQQQPQMMMPGIPKGPLPNNPYFQQQRFRNPNARTSRAANLTAEEEKAKDENSQLPFQTEDEKSMELDSQSDQQALFLIQNLQTSNEEGQPQLLVSDKTESGTQDSGDSTGKVSPPATPEYMLDQQLIPTSNENVDISLEQLSESSSIRQERELKLDQMLEGLLQPEEDNKEERDASLGENFQEADHITPEGSTLKAENFIQDLLPEEILESAESQSIPLPYHLTSTSPQTPESDSENAPRNEKGEESVKLSKQKNFPGYKGKLTGNEQEKRFALSKSSDIPSSSSSEKTTLNESKKGGITKIKAGKEKSRQQQQQQQLAKFKDKSKSEKDQQKFPEIGNNNETQEQQEFVAPKVIQRGFHPILPYSEKDPGPILVQMMSNVEQLMPPTMTMRI